MSIDTMGVRLAPVIMLVFGFITLTLMVIAIIMARRITKRSLYADNDGWVATAFATGFATLFLIPVSVALTFPFFTDTYWYHYKVSGHVESVSNSFADGSGDISDSPILRLEGSNTLFIAEDYRLVALDDRDISMRCTRQWAYLSADTYTCRLISVND